MQLKYHDDIQWQDLPKIERPFFARATIKYELSKPRSRLLTGYSFRDPLSEIVQRGRREIDPNALNRLLSKVEQGSILLVHTFEGDTPYPAFIWKKDDTHPDKGQWTLSQQLYSASEYHFNLLLSTVKRPQQRGSIKSVTAPTTEYGYISSSAQSPSVGESAVAEVAKTLGQFLYKVGSRTAVLATLTPRTAGGTTTYEIPNEPELRIIESDLEPARYQRRVDGEWQTTGAPAKRVVDNGRMMGFEALSPEDATSLKTTGGIPIAPQVKPTIEGYPPDSPPDTSKTMFPDKQGEVDSSTSFFPAEGSGAMASPGFNQGTDVKDVVGSSVMYNQSGDGDLKTAKGSESVVQSKSDQLSKLNSNLEFRKRSLELANDPDRGQVLVREGIGAARFEQATGRTVSRSVDGATDFVDAKLGAFDLKGPLLANDGTPIDITPKRIEGLGKSVVKEVNNSTASKAVVVDTLGLSRDQVSILKSHISSGVKNNKPIIYLE